MSNDRYAKIIQQSFENGSISKEDMIWILSGNDVELLPLLNAAYAVRYKYFGNKVKIHILNNVQNGLCPEDCQYCAQSKDADNEIDKYPFKEPEQILKEADDAYQRNAFRYCMVFSGRSTSKNNINTICDIAKQIKEKYPMEVCVSAGIIDDEDARKLKKAGVDRYNHNLNTSKEFYHKICTTHSYQDRLDTIKTAKKNGIEICSGVIVGLGESFEDIISVALELNDVQAKSIPVNFFIPVQGHRIEHLTNLTPEFCLRVLSMYRFVNPTAEIRAAAGREYHLRSMQVLSLYAANSIFAEGYLNTVGDQIDLTQQMIEDAGFQVDMKE